jgi:enamine deaminase RidA (YjgF/YER057c/UK114 family)
LAEAEIRRVTVPGLATASPYSHVMIDGFYAFLSGIVASDVPGGALPARTCTQSGGLAGGSNLEITVTARL